MAAKLILWGAMLKPISWTVIVSTAKQIHQGMPSGYANPSTKELIQAYTSTFWPWHNILKTMENHHFEWENPLFLWPFLIAMLVYQRVLKNFVQWCFMVTPGCFTTLFPSFTTKPHRFLLWSRESCRQRTIALGRFLWSVQSDATQLWRHIKDTVDGPAKSESPVDKWFIPLFTLWLCQNNYGKSPFLAMCPMKNGGSFHSYFLGDFQPSNLRWFIPWFSWLFNMFHPSKMGGGWLEFAGPAYGQKSWDKKSGDVEILGIMGLYKVVPHS